VGAARCASSIRPWSSNVILEISLEAFPGTAAISIRASEPNEPSGAIETDHTCKPAATA
jgi:hypothetical protein